MAVTISRVSTEDAQFALGETVVLADARTHLDLGGDWLQESATMVAWHVRGQHGSVTREVLLNNYDNIALLPFSRSTDQIVSQYFLNGGFIWVITWPARGETRVMGRKSLEQRVQD